MVQPATAAAPTLSVIWFIGQFQGVISAATPTASWRMRSSGERSFSGASKGNAFASSMKLRRCHDPAPVWPERARSIGAPISRLIACDISSARRS